MRRWFDVGQSGYATPPRLEEAREQPRASRRNWTPAQIWPWVAARDESGADVPVMRQMTCFHGLITIRPEMPAKSASLRVAK